MKRWTLVIILLIVIFGGVFGWDYVRSIYTKRFFKNFKPPPVTISSTRVKSEIWHPSLFSIGSLVAINGVNVNSQVPGQVMKILFQSGQYVEKDQPLVQLDDSTDQQTLLNDEAQLKLAQVNFDRQQALYTKRVAAKSALDDARAKLVSAQAAVAKAKVEIGHKLIRAPFAGKLGIREINLGQYIQPGDSLVPLQSLDPLLVDFSLPEQNLKQVKPGMKVVLEIQAYPDTPFAGKIMAITSKVDVNTRSFMVRAIVPNSHHKLYPGVFANVSVVLPERHNVMSVPETALTYSLYGDTVYLIQEKGKDKNGSPILTVEQAFVKVGKRVGNNVEIKQGLKVGDSVVTSGQLKLLPGSEVKVNNSVKIN
ncbi:MAG: efflux RND transporter periplasmic adaptor subunit [Gammaproteobacteria bacterium]|nr:efflux RND transporter periplasmic adaptor subunit [Gammaproteobacteria bacterium]MCH9743387.1 efflux RND transporter periplasmic adaptor subunit [Gammaproteobacteria bacterium]